MTKKGRVFSGIRPTGHAHLGNYLGAFKNYVALQDDYECVYCIVDLHALTTVEDTLNLKQNTYDLALDLLAVGIRPEETILFVQSHVPQVTELHTILSMVTPLGKLTDLPTFKEKVRQNPNNINYGLVGYPVLMSADILLYKTDLVPVGIDQAPHLEFAREVVRSFNYHFNTNVLIEPQMKAAEVQKVLGIDGKEKMGKSLNNQIELAATPEETRQRVMMMVTDPHRIKRTDPGNPDICNVFTLHKVFTNKEDVEMINIECRRAGIGCVDCKKRLAVSLNGALEPFRAKRTEMAAHPDLVPSVLEDGAKRARAIAEKTMQEVRAAVKLP
ncbi:MAG: tryptophan--tRNA ligase [Anaerolineales bacterium]